ncbi:MAG: hypothetical protein M3M88_02225 [Thermoproteota archaeon]|nr:hypothetical protein [Thermoproteota archaeon]
MSRTDKRKTDFEGLKKNWGNNGKEGDKTKNDHFVMLWRGFGFDKQRQIIEFI